MFDDRNLTSTLSGVVKEYTYTLKEAYNVHLNTNHNYGYRAQGSKANCNTYTAYGQRKASPFIIYVLALNALLAMIKT